MKKIASVVLSILALTLLASCGGDASASPAGIYTLDKAALEIAMKAAVPEAPAVEGQTADVAAEVAAAAAKMMEQMMAGMDGSFELKADNTCALSMTMMGQKQDKTGTWKLDGDKLSITVKEGDKDDTRVLNFADGVITMEEDKMTMKFNKAAK